MPRRQVFVLTLMAMTAFAANSLLCRLALKSTSIDAASFTSIRLISGAQALWLIVRIRGNAHGIAGNWSSALALFAYAACFSYAYNSLSVATGALLLFGAVQATMISYGLWHKESLRARQSLGFVCAFSGLVGLLLPGLTAPPLYGSILMLVSGVAWGVYSLRGKSNDNANGGDPTHITAGNFLRAVPFAIVLSVAMQPSYSMDNAGIWLAIASGAIASGLGYAIWYTALRNLKTTNAATIQLSVPVIAAIGGIIFLGEAITLRLLIAGIAILGGIALVIIDRKSG